MYLTKHKEGFQFLCIHFQLMPNQSVKVLRRSSFSSAHYLYFLIFGHCKDVSKNTNHNKAQYIENSLLCGHRR